VKKNTVRRMPLAEAPFFGTGWQRCQGNFFPFFVLFYVFTYFFKVPPSLFCIDVWGMFTLRIAFNFFTHLPLSAGIFIYLLLSIYWLNMGVLSLGLVIKNVPNVCFCGTSLRFFLGFYG